jgi:hypothetical protein
MIDLHEELELNIDIDLIAQMLKYSAMESSDFFRIINITFSRLEMHHHKIMIFHKLNNGYYLKLIFPYL